MQNSLHKRIVDISYKHKLGHIGSCLTAVDIIDEIYQKKKPDEPFILSSGHAGLALYVVLEKHLQFDAELLFNIHGVHPNRDKYINCSTGSLGQGLPIAVGMALADRTKDVYVLLSDGECAEGSIWEALEVVHKYDVSNLHIYVNANGWGAYDPIDSSRLKRKLMEFAPSAHIEVRRTNSDQYGLQGQDAHYHNLTEEEYAQAFL